MAFCAHAVCIMFTSCFEAFWTHTAVTSSNNNSITTSSSTMSSTSPLVLVLTSIPTSSSLQSKQSRT
eukprot:5873333-Amphidinium_carterae.1